MKRERYDLIFGLGVNCACSLSLRRAGLQHLSFPGDWTGPLWRDVTHPRIRHGLVFRAERLCRGMDGFLELKDLCFDGKHPWNGKDSYHNAVTYYVFHHDFTASGDLKEELVKVRAKYEHRLERLTALIRASSRVLVVRIDATGDDRDWPQTTLEDCHEARRLLAAAFPGVTFDFAVFNFERGRPMSDMIEERPDPGIVRFTFDYSNPRPGADPFQPDVVHMADFLAARYAVRDYRTSEERESHAASERRKKWAKVGAAGPFGYAVGRFLSKLTRFFRR